MSMTEKFILARTATDLGARTSCWKQEGLRVALVPTMGALHAGHLALVTKARLHADKVVGSIFVNPTQFGPGEDFDAYPRSPDSDARKMSEAGCDLIYLPDTDEMYPDGFATEVRVKGLTDVLCGAVRPGHFAGVATVVTKLFNQSHADVAVFGEKDFQQLLVIRQLVRDLDMGVEILAHPIVREADGLALSSRNAYLNADQRAAAPALYASLCDMATALRGGAAVETVLASASKSLQAAGFRIDYLEIRDSKTLVDHRTAGPLDPAKAYRIFAAAYLGSTRLIDSLKVA